ncbi:MULTISPECIES: DDE-type integrase/transposase/recombinase [unclassified Thioalkalivibrio]|uniref:DDE-type integrase/transposase/recombinase n=1 Tax=unclassified Thioalkalivibrio TaxID=2621013 RepID=UPI001E524F11|nr:MULTISPECIES: DDE-type integrase/transposase/recombinase [unclassified Thioalkalivibrio]
MDRIAAFTGISRASVSRILRGEGLNRLRALEPVEPPRRYEHEHPGDLLHLDIKKLARFRHPGHRVTGVRAKDSIGAGYEYVHVAIDDRSRIAYSAIHPAERAQDAIAHLEAAVRYYATLGITIRRVLTDNGPCYHARAFSQACRRLGIRHRRTRNLSTCFEHVTRRITYCLPVPWRRSGLGSSRLTTHRCQPLRALPG